VVGLAFSIALFEHALDLEEARLRDRFALIAHQIRAGVALQEALVNAMHHGNLELGRAGDHAARELAEQRRKQPPYAQRRVFVTARVSREQAAYAIRDEGPGFDARALPNPRDAKNLDDTSARGMGCS
jgi:anti-sigma regulatory factor (Ser/Thr protein kinase)